MRQDMDGMDKPQKTRRKRVLLQVQAEPGSRVFVAGTFNNWNPENKPLKQRTGDGLFSTHLVLPKGTYEYKFVINGTWTVDPECQSWSKNQLGSLNSVLKVH
jgi:1,4-alpha-glucan branching enzyme